LAVLIGEDAQGYLEDMVLAQCFAQLNRATMATQILNDKLLPKDGIDTIHNFIDPRDGIIRKGAVTAFKNEELVIPLNMRDGMLICRGKGNEEWNQSAPHGAGRRLARGEAKRQLSLTDFQTQMQGIVSTSVNQETLDEAPNAYKDSATIMELIPPTVEILDVVKPILNIKA